MMWGRHNSIVPKGFLRYRVLKLLDSTPMSGSEITKKLEEQTEGRWKPSPGSIYPLLAQLQENSFIEEASSDGGVKRYRLTDSGRGFLTENEKLMGPLRERLAHIGPGSGFGLSWYEFFTDRSAKILHGSAVGLFTALWGFHEKSARSYSEEDTQKVKEALDDAAQKIREVTKGDSE